MGIDRAQHQPDPSVPPIVAFDFDGTLTTKDSYTDFLAWRAGPARYVAGLARVAPTLLAYPIHRDRGRAKVAVTKAFLAGLSRDELEAAARRYAELRAHGLLRPDAVQTWRRWQAEGARMLIVTASPEQVVAPFASALGCDLLIGTRLAFDAQGRATGDFDGPNCRGQEKAVRLRAALGPEVRLTAAYGDTSGDHAMLALADEAGFRVFRGRP
jgi:phosphatidylglycerophosphatase C